jgi:hypothetical protein
MSDASPHLPPTADFDFLDSDFDVDGERLADPRQPDSGWRSVPATSHADLWLNGMVSIDEMWFPDDAAFGLSLRTYDVGSRQWAVRWISSRGGGLQPPVYGSWRDGSCFLTGADTCDGAPIQASYSWFDVTTPVACWEQCFSFDDGQTWQPNWRMRYRRRRASLVHPQLPRLATGFDFLAGSWWVEHVRALDPIGLAIGTGSEFEEFSAPYRSTTYLAGAVSVDECQLNRPDARGLVFRIFDAATMRWSIYWVNSSAGTLDAPVHGHFDGDVGTFGGTETLRGHRVRVRFRWSEVGSAAPSWQQSFSVDDGQSWTTNWTMRFRRADTRQEAAP